jgi:hypothetical protein
MLIISDDIQRKEYLEKHLPYRINSMLAHDLIMLRKKQAHFDEIKDRCYGDSTIVEPIFEISLIFGRSLLNFLGLTLDAVNSRIIRFNPKADDLTVKSLFSRRDYCPLDEEIVLENHDGFCKIIKLANKSVAHLTSVITETQSEEHDILPDVRQAIYKLVLKYLPEISKEKIWWYTQVETI